jgi:hypothetical protein
VPQIRTLLRAARFALLFALFVLCVPKAQADPVYAFTGTITLPGNNVCGGQCIETILVTFDFKWDPLNPVFPSWNFGTLSNLTISSSGPLVFAAGGSGVDQFPYWGLANGLGDIVDLLNVSGFSFVNAATPPVFGASVYSCTSVTCTTDFAPGGYCQIYGCPITSTFSESVLPMPTPEPSSLLLLALGFFALIGLTAARRAPFARPSRVQADSLTKNRLSGFLQSLEPKIQSQARGMEALAFRVVSAKAARR